MLTISVDTCLVHSNANAQHVYMQRAAAEEVVDMRGGSAELTQTYFYSLVR